MTEPSLDAPEEATLTGAGEAQVGPIFPILLGAALLLALAAAARRRRAAP